MNVLITGGAGYIGTHTCVELLEAGYGVIVFDNFCNSKPESLQRVERITDKTVTVIKGDIRDKVALIELLRKYKCEAVIHFAGLKAVGESFEIPLHYYDNNINGTLSLLEAMSTVGVNNLIFSSSATIYGEPEQLPLTENHPLSATNPYGRTKLMIEEILRDLHHSQPNWRIALLRYFNPVGAHESGLIGEDPQGMPNNLIPFVSQVAVGRREFLSVWGDDYDTVDGTGVRDYIHVLDLANGHLKALEFIIDNKNKPQCVAINLGTGKRYSVFEVVNAFEKASGCKIAYKIMPRRLGDVAKYYAGVKLSEKLLGWQAKRNLQTMCQDSWNWQKKNPNGY